MMGEITGNSVGIAGGWGYYLSQKKCGSQCLLAMVKTMTIVEGSWCWFRMVVNNYHYCQKVGYFLRSLLTIQQTVRLRTSQQCSGQHHKVVPVLFNEQDVAGPEVVQGVSHDPPSLAVTHQSPQVMTLVANIHHQPSLLPLCCLGKSPWIIYKNHQ